MLALVAALHLVALGQLTGSPREITPRDAASGDEAAAPADERGPSDAQGAPADEAPPLPRRGERDAAEPGSTRAAAPPLEPGRYRQISLLSAEPLGGGSASLIWMGWSSLGIMYGQGITQRDDLAAFADFEWTTTEMRLGALYRRPLGKAGIFDMAGRLSAAWYLDFGSTYIHEENHSDRGIEVTPGLAFSSRGAGGVFSLLGEGPITVTTKYSAGLLFSPRVSLSYETALYPELTVGARAGVGYRAGSGDAPLDQGRAELLFVVLAGYQLL
jgi:hypothetical protein